MIDPFQGTGAPLTSHGWNSALDELGPPTDPAALWAILAVETRGFGYQQNRRLKVLFERHVFRKRTSGRFDAVAPDISNSDAGGYVGGPAEYDRIKRAAALDAKAALESASWGLGQVMGFNATLIGYRDAKAMIVDFNTGEDAQLLACARFIAANSALLKAFHAGQWERIAFFYNGADYARRGYHEKLRAAHAQFLQELPNVDVRAAQARLAYVGFNPRGIDGLIGPATAAALAAFQKSRGLASTNGLDAETSKALRDAAGV